MTRPTPSSSSTATTVTTAADYLVVRARRCQELGEDAQALEHYRHALSLDAAHRDALLGLLELMANADNDSANVDEIRRFVDVATIRNYVEMQLSDLDRQTRVELDDLRTKESLVDLYAKLGLGKPKF